MAVNRDKPGKWKADIAQSVDMYNDWFMNFAPMAFRETRIQTTKDVEAALHSTSNLTNIQPATMRKHPEILPTLRMSTCPPLAVDRLIGLAGVSTNLVKRMELEKKLPMRMSAAAADADLAKIAATIQKMAKATPFDNYTLGEAYSKMGRLKEAEACFRDALKSNPNYDPARASLIKTLSSVGKYDDAFAECLTGYKAAKTEMLSRYYRILYQNVQEQKLALRRIQDAVPATAGTVAAPGTVTTVQQQQVQTQSRTVGETR